MRPLFRPAAATSLRSLCGRLAAASAAALWLALAPAASGADFSFAALGDAPYTAEDEPRFVAMIAEINREPLAFVVHVGDFKAAIAPCSDGLYLQRRQWFDLSRHPLVFVPGDNEWTDCRRAIGSSHDPLERMGRLRQIFFTGDFALGQEQFALARQSGAAPGSHDYPEHARWEYGDLLFVTLNAPGPDNNSRADPAESARRTAAARDWLEMAFRRARARDAKGVVVIMHANPWTATGTPRRGFHELIATLIAQTRAFGREVLLVHGDTHSFRVDQPLLDAGNKHPLANFTRVEVFGYPVQNWVRIRVLEQDGRVRFEARPGS